MPLKLASSVNGEDLYIGSDAENILRLQTTGKTISPVSPYTIDLSPYFKKQTVSASATGVSVYFDVPYWANKITVLCDDVSTNGTNYPVLRGGASQASIENSGYYSVPQNFTPGAVPPAAAALQTTGFVLQLGNAGNIFDCVMTLHRLTAAGDRWSFFASGQNKRSTAEVGFIAFGSKLFSDLGALELTSINKVDSWDSGSFTVIFEM